MLWVCAGQGDEDDEGGDVGACRPWDVVGRVEALGKKGAPWQGARRQVVAEEVVEEEGGTGWSPLGWPDASSPLWTPAPPAGWTNKTDSKILHAHWHKHDKTAWQQMRSHFCLTPCVHSDLVYLIYTHSPTRLVPVLRTCQAVLPCHARPVPVYSGTASHQRSPKDNSVPMATVGRRHHWWTALCQHQP